MYKTFTALAALFSIASTAFSANVVSYESGVDPTAGTTGAADPTTQGWVANSSGITMDPFAHGLDSTIGGWRITDGTSAVPFFYQHDLSAGEASDMTKLDWTATWTTAVNADAINQGGGGVDDYYKSVPSRQNNNAMWVEVAGEFFYVLTFFIDANQDIQLTDGTSTFQITTANNQLSEEIGAAAPLANYITFTLQSIGGVVTLSDSLGGSHGVVTSLGLGTQDRVVWGATSGFGQGSTTWNALSVDTVSPIITEVMYNPDSNENSWEWVELYNPGVTAIDLAGWVFDDDDNPGIGGAANIATGSIPAGGTAILFDGDALTAADFAAAWGSGINLVPVSNFSTLGNGGCHIGIWSSFATYDGGSGGAFVNQLDDIDFGSAGFPSSTNGRSIYLIDLDSDNSVGANWALSTEGGVTPAYTGYSSALAAGNTGEDTGSPGVPPYDAVADTGSTMADMVASTVDPAGTTSLLTNDTGVLRCVISADTASALGAIVSVNEDGTFTYEPTGVASLIALPLGSSVTDTFDYTMGGVVTAGADFDADADLDADADNRWEDESGVSGLDFALAPSVTRVTGTSLLPGISAAYDFPGGSTGNADGARLSIAGTATDQSFQNAPGDWTNEDVTIEMWFKPDNLTPAPLNGQVLFEDGGGTGIGLLVDNNELRLRKAPGGGNVGFNIASIAGEFIHAVGTYDVSAGAMELFVNGVSVGTATPGGGDWSGGDPVGVGTRGGANLGGIGGGQAGTESFDGQIAKFRVYRNQLLTASEVTQNFKAVVGQAGTDTATVTMTVEGVNDPPTAVATTHTVAEDGPAGTFSYVSTDPDTGDVANHIYRSQTMPAMGMLTENFDGTFTFDPNGDFESLAPGEIASVTFDLEVCNPYIGTPILNYDGSFPDGTPAVWESNGPAGFNATFGADVTHGPVVSAIPFIDYAYTFTGGSAENNLADLNTYSNGSASWEFWLKPNDTGDAGQVLFESGGNGNGMDIWYAKGANADGVGTINFTIDAGDNATQVVTVSAPIDNSEFRHVVAVYGRDETHGGATRDRLEIYIDGVSVDVDTSQNNIDDWSGTDNGGIGSFFGTSAFSVVNGQYEGEVAIFRFHNEALTAKQIVDAANPQCDTATVTVNVVGENDGPTANDDVASANEDGPAITGNVLSGAGADTDPDINGGVPEDALYVLSVDTTGTLGDVTMTLPQEIAFIGSVTLPAQDAAISTFQTVALGRDFANPVVIAQPVGSAGPDAVIAQIISVDAGADTFDVRLIEPPNLDQSHGPETVSFLVVEAGAWQLPDGTLLEAGTLDTNTLTRRLLAGFDTVNYASAFTTAPSVMSQAQTVNETDGDIFFKTRQRNNGTASFEVALEEAEGPSGINSFGTHTTETIGWIAIEAGAGGWGGFIYEAGTTATNVTGNYTQHTFGVDFGSAPNLVGAMNTYAGVDPTQLRQRNITGTGVQFRAEEDTNQDGETGHAPEAVNYLAIGGAGILSGFEQSETVGEFTYDPNGQFENLDAGDMVTDTFTYVVTDSFGNTDMATVTVTITGQNDAPEVTPPGIPDQMIFTSSPTVDVPLFPHFEDVDDDDTDTALTYMVTANTNPALIQTDPVDSSDGILTINTPCTLIGTADITVTVMDSNGASVSDTFTVEVEDDVAPVIDGAKDIVTNAPVGGTAPVSFANVTASDKVDPAPMLVCTPDDSMEFPVGSTEITCVATDASGNMTTETFFVHVLEIQMPSGERAVDIISLRNDPAPGAGDPGGPPAAATILIHNRAYINNSGDIVYEASMLNAGTNSNGVFTNIGGTDSSIAVRNSAAPGSGGNYGTFSNLAINDSGGVIYQSLIGGIAQFVDAGGGATNPFRVGEPAPGTTGQFNTMQKPAIASNGDLLTQANLKLGVGGVTFAEDTGIWSSGAAGIIAREGDLSTIPGVEYGQVHPRIVTSNASEQIAFSSFLIEPVFDPTDNTAVFSGTLGVAPTMVVREGDAAPGAGGANFLQFVGESVNSSGDVVFRSILSGGGATSVNNEGLWTNSGGPLRMIAREGEVAPCLGTTDVAFDRFTTIRIGDDGTVCFFAYLKDATATPVVGSGNDGSLWRYEPASNTLHLIAREGEIANSTDGAVIKQITGFDCSDMEGVTFHATLVDSVGDTTTSTNNGVWLDKGLPDVAPLLVLRRGDIFNLGGVDHTVTNTSLEAQSNAGGGTGGYGRVISDSGEILLKVSLNNNRSGLFKIGLPVP